MFLFLKYRKNLVNLLSSKKYFLGFCVEIPLCWAVLNPQNPPATVVQARPVWRTIWTKLVHKLGQTSIDWLKDQCDFKSTQPASKQKQTEFLIHSFLKFSMTNTQRAPCNTNDESLRLWCHKLCCMRNRMLHPYAFLSLYTYFSYFKGPN